MTTVDQIRAAEILGVKPRTLEGWRLRGCGPVYVKYGGRVVYETADLEAFKAAHRRTSTSDLGRCAPEQAAA
jgi:hypothetical protein